MAKLAADNLKTTLATHLIESGQTTTKQELTEYADSLVALFEILIEADKKLPETDDRYNCANT